MILTYLCFDVASPMEGSSGSRPKASAPVEVSGEGEAGVNGGEEESDGEEEEEDDGGEEKEEAEEEEEGAQVEELPPSLGPQGGATAASLFSIHQDDGGIDAGGLALRP